MPIRYFKNKESGEIVKTLKTMSVELWEEVLQAPSSKFTVLANAATGKSKIKDLSKILTERARNYSRDVDAPDTIHINLANGLKESVHTNLLNNKGERRKKIDDI